MELELKFSDARLSLRHLRHNFLVFQVACGNSGSRKSGPGEVICQDK
jgi:hypothetical protein